MQYNKNKINAVTVLQALVGLMQHAWKYANDEFIAANHVAHRGHVIISN